ncbi:MAG TPA: pilus assembly protein TadG-related protein, partial [Bryobacteraceae bacterium]|nr:pilus assembly protein TadG-related protein [Bryobacteraceae bacterium]
MTVRRRQKQSGFVLITMAAACIAMLGALGLAVDMGRIFIAKSETQAYVDAQAIAAALQLDGTSTG